VIHCEIDKGEQQNKDADWSSFTLVNSERYDLQSLTPQTRLFEKERLKQTLQALVANQVDQYPSHQIGKEFKKQGWFLNCERGEAERIIGECSDFTFCIRNSSVENAYVLTYKNTGVYHSLVVPWKQWYFSGKMTDNFEVQGLFFTSIPHLVWYWRKMGQGRQWVPLSYH